MELGNTYLRLDQDWEMQEWTRPRITGPSVLVN